MRQEEDRRPRCCWCRRRIVQGDGYWVHLLYPYRVADHVAEPYPSNVGVV